MHISKYRICHHLLTTMSSIKGITVVEAPVDGYPTFRIDGASSAMTASLHLLFSHVADFHRIMMHILSEKYGLDEEEMLSTITEHPLYREMSVHPTINSLLHFEQADTIKPLNSIVQPEEIPATPIPSAASTANPPKPRRRKLKIVK